MIATPIVCVVIVFVVLLNTVILPKMKLDKAIKLIDKKEYEEAYKLLENLDYKDSQKKLEEIKPAWQKKMFSEATVGSNVIFGEYEQDNNASDGKEDIEWIVLKKGDNKVLLISKYALDCQPYRGWTWETCFLRKWMNETFLKEAFDEKEQAMIQTTTVTADTDPGNSTMDEVFLLSISEAEKYFTSDEQRKCVPTKYALQQGVYTDDDYMVDGQATCWWWLRSPGDFRKCAASVGGSGRVNTGGSDINYDHNGVRAALWINLEP